MYIFSHNTTDRAGKLKFVIYKRLIIFNDNFSILAGDIMQIDEWTINTIPVNNHRNLCIYFGMH